MKIYEEKSLRDFEFWSGGRDWAQDYTDDQLDQVEAILEDMYPDGVEDTFINDLFWFEHDQIDEWLGIHRNDSGEIQEWNADDIADYGDEQGEVVEGCEITFYSGSGREPSSIYGEIEYNGETLTSDEYELDFDEDMEVEFENVLVEIRKDLKSQIENLEEA